MQLLAKMAYFTYVQNDVLYIWLVLCSYCWS